MTLAVGAALATTAAAQRRPSVDIGVPPSSQLLATGPVVQARDMLAGARIRELLSAGFTARFHFRVELWSEGGWLNDVERRLDYDVLARYVPMEQLYEVIQVTHDRPFRLGKFGKIEDAESAIARPTRVPISAFKTSRRLYYQVTLQVEILSVSDLDEVDRWLRGELQPAISGGRNPGTVLTRGFRTLAARLLGGETREYEARTPAFRIP